MTTEKALDLALEALELSSVTVDSFGVQRKTQEAITAIKQARALDKKAENARELGLDYEPYKGLSEHLAQATNGRVRIDPVTGNVGIGTAPVQPAPAQEPVAWQIRIGDSPDWAWADTEADADFYGKQSGLRYEKRPLNTTPPAAKREWTGLTDEEIQTVWDGVMDGAVFTRREVYKAIEAKLKEKNNG
jgi:hypothetical protein